MRFELAFAARYTTLRLYVREYGFTLVKSTGPSQGIQVNFTAIGARLFYDRPLVDFTNRSVEIENVFGSAADRLLATSIL
jgi:hypothetical protein